ncbi:MAG: formylglycine-generating enzyme family protein, partial [Verrucomicrobiota bacterium]
RNWRLPSEAEWEYACRAGTETPFPTGAMPDLEAANLLYDESGNRVGKQRILPRGWGKPNAFGLHDMIGNVCEWVEDDWVPDYETIDPNGAARQSDSDRKVIRGGAWDSMPRLARSSYRDFAPPAIRRDNLGFRVACDL